MHTRRKSRVSARKSLSWKDWSVADPERTRISSPSGAAFSRCGKYRYALWRNWDPERPKILFIGLNPSRADARHNDPTIRRCINFARDWGYGGLLVGNLFALRSPHPHSLRHSQNPVGPRNDYWLRLMSCDADRTLACWGNHGALIGRDAVVAARFSDLWCLRRNRGGAPAHPLYMNAGQKPSRWPGFGSGNPLRPPVPGA